MTAGTNAQQSTLLSSEDGIPFRDLNKNGRLDVYEDPRQPIAARVEDLLSQMTLAEKAGHLFINGAIVNEDGSIEERPGAPGLAGRSAMTQMVDQQMTHFNLWEIPSAQAVATWNNNLQRFAESTRLGIPVTIASDPRNHFSHNIFAMAATDFSQWCETLGFGAIGDVDLVRQLRRHRPAGIPGGGDSGGAPSPDRPRDRAALGAHQWHLRRGRPAHRRAWP